MEAHAKFGEHLRKSVQEALLSAAAESRDSQSAHKHCKAGLWSFRIPLSLAELLRHTRNSLRRCRLIWAAGLSSAYDVFQRRYFGRQGIRDDCGTFRLDMALT